MLCSSTHSQKCLSFCQYGYFQAVWQYPELLWFCFFCPILNAKFIHVILPFLYLFTFYCAWLLYLQFWKKIKFLDDLLLKVFLQRGFNFTSCEPQQSMITSIYSGLIRPVVELQNHWGLIFDWFTLDQSPLGTKTKVSSPIRWWAPGCIPCDPMKLPQYAQTFHQNWQMFPAEKEYSKARLTFLDC